MSRQNDAACGPQRSLNMIRTPRTPALVRHGLLGLGAAAAVVFMAGHVRPVFMERASVVSRLAEPLRDDDVALVTVPLTGSFWIPADQPPSRADAGAASSTGAWARFDADRRAFAQDLLATGRLTRARAWRIADAAVRHAYAERIPPALVLGVMLTENASFKPTARSNVGAQGLMQIMPRLWKPVLGGRFGRDLRDDATNLRYGIYILRYMHNRVPRWQGPEASYRTALLRYNGCVRGRNTKNCHRYPDVVQRYVLRNAKSICAGRSFRECVILPLHQSRFGGTGQVRVASVR